MNDDLIKQLIKVKQVYETPDGSKFDSEMAAIAHIKNCFTTSSQNTQKREFVWIDNPYDWSDINHGRIPKTGDYDLWNIPPVTSNFGHISFGASKKPINLPSRSEKPSVRISTEDFSAPIPKPESMGQILERKYKWPWR
jgi:hypothetical protein